MGNAGIESRFDRDLHRQSGGKVLQNLMIFSSLSLLLRIVCLLSGEQNPDLKPGGVSAAGYQWNKSCVNR